jgi:uncharacterized protein YjbI with pentapeptide repeats
MNDEQAQPAPTFDDWTTIVQRSDALQLRLQREGVTDEAVAAARTLLEDCSRAGRLTSRYEWRHRLYNILDYWAATLRLITDELVLAPDLAESEIPVLPEMEPDELVAVAHKGGRVIDRAVLGMEVAGDPHDPSRRKVVHDLNFQGGRLVGATLTAVHLAGAATLTLSGLLDCTLDDILAYDLQAAHISVWHSDLTLTVDGEAKFAHAAMRGAEFRNCEIQAANFVDCDLASYTHPDLEAAAALHQLAHREGRLPGVRFTDCHFGQVNFDKTRLDGAVFERCTFRDSATFKGASLPKVVFKDCTFGEGDEEGGDVVADLSRANDASSVRLVGKTRGLAKVKLPDADAVSV